MDRDVTASPKSTTLINGVRPRSESMMSAAGKKPRLPELLSPLHPSLFEDEPDKPEKPRKTAADKASKADNPKTEGPSSSKKKKVVLPPLLSPTLPPVVEEALKERKQTAGKTVASQSSESSNTARKTVAAPVVRVEDEDKPARPSKIVTFRFKKNTKRAKELLSLPSKSAKAAQKETSASTETKESKESKEAPPPAKKRPRPTDEPSQEPVASKRPKTAPTTTESSTISKTARPPTPLKATAMSRVTSNQSQAGHTPAATTATPAPERPPTRSAEPPDPKTLAAIEAWRDKHAHFQQLGSKLKHARDALSRGASQSQTQGQLTSPANVPGGDDRRAMALHLEMVLAYMVAFNALNQGRMLERKVCDITAWESLLPHFAELRSRAAGHHRALRALAAQLHAICLEQICNCMSPALIQQDNNGGAMVGRWVKHNRMRVAVWQEANGLFERVGSEGGMRVVMGPWTQVEEGVGVALGIMRRWAEREGVRWVQEVILNPKEKDKEGDRIEREKPRERERDKVSMKERERDRDKERDRDRIRDRERERDRDRERERDRSRQRGPMNGVRDHHR